MVNETVEDVGFYRRDWIPVFQVLEDHEKLSDEGVPERLKQDTFENKAGVEVESGIGGQDIYQIEGTDGYLEFNWGAPQAQVGKLADVTLQFHGDYEGEQVRETEREIVDQYSAPYLDQHEPNEIGLQANLDLPLEYDMQDWEETVNTAVQITEELQQYQDSLREVSEQYPQ